MSTVNPHTCRFTFIPARPRKPSASLFAVASKPDTGTRNSERSLSEGGSTESGSTEIGSSDSRSSRSPRKRFSITNPAARRIDSTTEPLWVRWLLTIVALAFMSLFLLVPLVFVFANALSYGFGVYWNALTDPITVKSFQLTFLAAGIAVPLNVIFGLAAAWCIGKFEFPGKGLLVTLIDLPFAISPVIAGLLFILLFGGTSCFGAWLMAHDISILFAVPGVVIATVFVTVPFVARELIPVIQSQGSEEEQAALVLGASGWQTFLRVTLPNIKWGLLYGIILCNARAIGEFGAVAVVCGRVRGETTTVPLHIEQLYNEIDPQTGQTAAFAVASVLALFAVLTLIIKTIIEFRSREMTTR